MNCLHFPPAGGPFRTPLVIVHGLFGSARNWRSIGENISKELGVECFAVNLRNHGGCQLRGPMTSWKTLSSDLELFVRERVGDHQKFNLLGHSLVC